MKLRLCFSGLCPLLLSLGFGLMLPVPGLAVEPELSTSVALTAPSTLSGMKEQASETHDSLIVRFLSWLGWFVRQHHYPPDGYDESKLPTLDDIKDTIPDGSLLLGSGNVSVSRLIEVVQGSDFSHSGIIIRLYGDDELYLWTSDGGYSIDDQIHKERHSQKPGVSLVVLRDFMKTQHDVSGGPDPKYRFAVARVKGVSVDSEKLKAFMLTYDGVTFPKGAGLLAWLKGLAGIEAGDRAMFCSQLVAKTYQLMGWLQYKHPPNYFTPSLFSKPEVFNRQLVEGITVKAPEYFKVGP